ncbi:MAG: LamG domain-containing protein [Deltaproteobacteria bacterium]|nr:LamG domain-containing protein [Deltaproteobacteria bacterium]
MRVAAVWVLLSGCHLIFDLDQRAAQCKVSGIQLCLTFEDDLGDLETTDDSGEGNDARLLNVSPAKHNGQGAVSLEATSKIEIENMGALDVPGPLTFDAFFRWLEGSDPQAILDNFNQWGLGVQSGVEVSCTLGFADFTFSILVGGNFVPGRWHHVACVFDPDIGTQLYLDGVPIKTDPAGIGKMVRMNGGAPFVMVGSFNSGTGHFLGELDDLRVITRALSSDEILAAADAE